MRSKSLCFIFLFIATLLLAVPLPVRRTTLAPRNPAIFETHPSIAVNMKTKQTLVVWERHPGNHPGHSTWGRLLSPQGAPAGAAFTIVPSFNPYTPSVVYNPGRNQFALIYSDEVSGNSKMSVYAQLLNSKGRRTGQPVRISADDPFGEPSNHLPDILYHPQSGNYLVFWQRAGQSITQGLYGAVLSPELRLVSGPTLIVRGEPDGMFVRIPLIWDLQAHSTTDRIVLCYSLELPGALSSTNPQWNNYLGVLNSDLSNIAPSNFKKINPKPITTARGMSVDFLPDGTGVVAYSDANSVKIRRLSAALKFAGGVVPAFRAPLNTTRMVGPQVAFTTGRNGSQGIVVATQDPLNTAASGAIWAQQLDQTGRSVGNPFKIEDDFDVSSSLTLVAVPGSPTFSTYRFRVVYAQGIQLNIPPTPQESSGLILLNLGFN